MAILKPFRGIRPNKLQADKVAAPPYDVLSSAEARELAKDNPYTFLHINKPEIDLDPAIDVHDDRVYQKGAENLQRFIAEKIISKDEAESFYVYRQILGEHQQTGLVALASVEEYESGLIKKHEFTRPDKENDRVRHIDCLNAQVGPVFLTYQSESSIDAIVAQCVEFEAEYNFTSADGVRHIFWVINDEALIKKIGQQFQKVPCLYVADGHHRSAAAMRIKQLRQQGNSDHTGEEAYNFFLAVVFPAKEMRILDYNRIVSDLNGLQIPEFFEMLQVKFTIEESALAYKPDACHEFGMYINRKWYSLVLRDGVIDEGDPVASLDVSVLQDNILAPLLGIGDPRSDNRIDFVGGVRGMKELEARVDSGEFVVAFACYPTTIENLINIADAGEVMPPKSTWFEPKLRTGLVIHSLD